MGFSTQQTNLIKAEILNDPTLSSQGNDGDALNFIADALNSPSSPAFWVWRTSVSRSDIYNSNPQPENSNWNWTTYKTQAVAEQNAWTQIFMGDQANFSQPNVRAGVAAIFTGNAPANAQQAHCLAVGRRQATRLEKILASGTGTTGAPATMGFEGSITPTQVDACRRS